MSLNVASGTYTGNTTGQSITGLGFKPKAVFISADTITPSMSGEMCLDSMPAGNGAMIGDNNPADSNTVSSYDANGFTLGTATVTNTLSVGYRWFAVGGDSTSLATGTYTGNGSSQSVTGLSFQPAIVIVCCFNTSDSRAVMSTVSGTGIWMGTNAAVLASSITALNASGFSVGSASTVNGSGFGCYWLAIPAITGHAWGGSYTGNGSTQSITTPNFQPDAVSIKNAGGVRGAWRASSAMSGDQTDNWQVQSQPVAGLVTSFISTGFALGSDSTVNTNATTYYAFALKNTSAAVAASASTYLMMGVG